MNICEKAAFKSMFLKYHPDIERYVMSRGISNAEALDIVQESFLRLWDKCKDVTERSLKSFLFTTSERIIIDDYRKQKSQRNYMASLRWKADKQDGQYKLEMEEFKMHLEKALATMKPIAREVFMMHRFEKMKYREIAQKLDISQKAIEKRMNDALMHLAVNKIPKIR